MGLIDKEVKEVIGLVGILSLSVALSAAITRYTNGPYFTQVYSNSGFQKIHVETRHKPQYTNNNFILNIPIMYKDSVGSAHSGILEKTRYDDDYFLQEIKGK